MFLGNNLLYLNDKFLIIKNSGITSKLAFLKQKTKLQEFEINRTWLTAERYNTQYSSSSANESLTIKFTVSIVYLKPPNLINTSISDC